ncbi:MBL fold metallo-hydrolase [Pedobacter sp. HMF7647]|uniref:MBL fold metallo-hydrolase n=1 Tax=Hufsiella arboris TaxID=2695275 RepID=A0A7K1YDV3_9SPHI|nr:MBL fold metallo-hydrolase [Hufsiella arboris]MXV52784.1 MBL fold metallo-hydrolase [Hufsiella arboris]
MFKAFGQLPSGSRLSRIKRSPHYRSGAFQNQEPTDVMLKTASFFKVMLDFLNKPKNTQPSAELPSVNTDLRKLENGKINIVWFGHSSYLLDVNGIKLLIDPVFSGHASPFDFFGKAFPGSNTYQADDMPDLDAVILTHDHYDHLDYETILKLKSRTRHFFTSLGVGSHLEYWGIKPASITELDWWESVKITHSIELTAAPARHFSGRGIKRFQTLWSSFILKAGDSKIFLGGDSGYDDTFKQVGEKYGPFDIALLECGQYGDSWPYIHMTPEETVQAAIDLKAQVLMPVHWAKFTLALHSWHDSADRVTAEAKRKNLKTTTPLIGEIVTLHESYPNKRWWDINH